MKKKPRSSLSGKNGALMPQVQVRVLSSRQKIKQKLWKMLRKLDRKISKLSRSGLHKIPHPVGYKIRAQISNLDIKRHEVRTMLKTRE